MVLNFSPFELNEAYTLEFKRSLDNFIAIIRHLREEDEIKERFEGKDTWDWSKIFFKKII